MSGGSVKPIAAPVDPATDPVKKLQAQAAASRASGTKRGLASTIVAGETGANQQGPGTGASDVLLGQANVILDERRKAEEARLEAERRRRSGYDE